MKRFYTLFILVVGVIWTCILLTQNLKSELKPVDILPVDSAVVVEWHNIGQTIKKLKLSPLGEVMFDTDFQQVLEQFGLPATLRQQYKKMSTFIGYRFGNLNLEKLFGHQSVLALLAEDKEQSSLQDAFRNNAILITELEGKISIPRIITTAFPQATLLKPEAYQGVPIYEVAFPSGETFTLARYKNLILCSFGSAGIQRCLDQALSRMIQTTSGLELNREYMSLKQRGHTPGNFFLYADAESIGSLSATNIEEQGGVREPLLQRIAVYYNKIGKRSQLTAITQMDARQLSILSGKYNLAPPTDDALALRLSPDAYFYFHTNWLNWSRLWDNALQDPSIQKAGALFLLSQQVNEYSGMEMKEVLDLFGSEFSILVDEVDTHSSGRVALGCFCFEVNDAAGVATLLQRLLEKLPTKQVMVNGVPVVSLVMAGGLIQPAYAIIDNYLIIGDNTACVEHLVQADSARLVDQAEFKFLGDGFHQANNLTTYIKTSKLELGLRKLITLLLLVAEIGDETPPEENFLVVEHLILPLLESIKNVHTKGIRGYLKQEEFILQGTFLFEGEQE